MRPRILKALPKLIQKEQPMAKVASQLEKTPVMSEPQKLPTEAASLLERQEDREKALKFLESQGINPGELRQLEFPETIYSTIDDPELAKYATDLGMRLRAEALAKKNALEAVKEGIPARRPSVLTKQQMLEKRKEDAIAEETKKRLQQEFEETKAEGVRDIYLPKSKAAMVGGAVGAGTLAASELAQASEGPTISQFNPEFASDVVQPESKDFLSHFEQKYGTYDIPGGVEKLLETVDKYTGRPVRAAALSALKGESPVTGAIESVSKNQDVEGRQVARQFLQNLEDRGFRTRAPVDPKLEQLRQLGVEIEGKKPEEYLPSNEFPAEGPLGFAADMTLDPTNLAGMGLGTKVGKGFSKVRGLIK